MGRGIVVPDAVIAEVKRYSVIGLTKGIDSMFKLTADADVKSTTDPDTVKEPVIIADPENGNGVVDIPDNWEPSPTYVPKDAVEIALEDTLVLTTNPKLGDIDAVAEPLAILDKFNPVIPEAGILVNPEPSPSNEPENDPDTPSVTISEPDITELAFEIKPFFIINSFAILSFFHCPKRG